MLEIEGAFGEENFGDDALMMVLHRELTRYVHPKNIVIRTKIGSFCENFDYLCPGSPVYIPGQFHRVKAKHKIYGGGTQFFSFGNERTAFDKIKLYGRQAPNIILRKIINKCHSFSTYPQQVHYLGVGLGPFCNDVVPKNIISSLNEAATLSVRDTNSSALLDRVGATYSKDADICFLENYEYKSPRLREKPENALIILRDWDFDNEFLNMDSIIDVIEAQDGINYSFALIGGDRRWKDKFEDRNVNYYHYRSGPGEIDKFIQHLKSFDVIVSARYHGLVYATLLGVPSIAIAVEPKLSVAAKDLNLAGIVGVHDLSSLSAVINNMNYRLAIERIRNTVIEQRVLAKRMLIDLVEKLKDEFETN